MVNGEWCLSAAHAGRLPFNAANAQRLFTIYHLLFTSDLSVSADGQRLVNAAVRARDDVDADEFADTSRSRGPGVGRGLDRRRAARRPSARRSPPTQSPRPRLGADTLHT